MPSRKGSANGDLSAYGHGRADMWPGITRGFDGNCVGCSWAVSGGVYQVKLRSPSCPNHGGSLEECLRRMARSRSMTPSSDAGDGGKWDAG